MPKGRNMLSHADQSRLGGGSSVVVVEVTNDVEVMAVVSVGWRIKTCILVFVFSIARYFCVYTMLPTCPVRTTYLGCVKYFGINFNCRTVLFLSCWQLHIFENCNFFLLNLGEEKNSRKIRRIKESIYFQHWTAVIN